MEYLEVVHANFLRFAELSVCLFLNFVPKVTLEVQHVFNRKGILVHVIVAIKGVKSELIYVFNVL